MDVDGEVVGVQLTRKAAYRLAWRSMCVPARCVDICHERDVCEPVAAWVANGSRWSAERLEVCR